MPSNNSRQPTADHQVQTFLRDAGLSPGGVYQLLGAQPLAAPRDRQALRTLLVSLARAVASGTVAWDLGEATGA